MKTLARDELRASEAFKVDDIVEYHAPELHGQRRSKRRIGRVVGFSRDQWGVRVLFENTTAAVREDMEHLVYRGNEQTQGVRERRSFSKRQGDEWLVWVEEVPVGETGYRSPFIRV